MDPPECSGHSHDHGDHTDDLGLSLRPCIDFDRVYCLNEEVAGSGKAILKLHEERLSDFPVLLSPDDDPELLLHIPFTEAVVLKSISVRNARVCRVKLFADRTSTVNDCDTARDATADQVLQLLPPEHFGEGTIDYPCRPAGRFSQISSLTLFFEEIGDGEEEEVALSISFVGLKGKGTNIKRVAVETVYESRGMKKDHKVPGEGFGAHSSVT